MRVYISGPMNGRKDLNYPAFNYAARQLRQFGHQVENPAENERFEPRPTDWRGWMTLALIQLVKCDTVVLLPEWETSRGAKIEERLARDLGMRVVTWQEFMAA